MLLRLNKYTYLFIALCFFVAAAIIEYSLLKKHPETHLIHDFQIQLTKNEKVLNQQTEKIANLVADDDFDGSFFETLKSYCSTLEETGTGYLVYQSGQLVFWSNRMVSFYDKLRGFKKTNGLIQLPNGFYLAVHKSVKNYDVVGLHLIKYNYEHENKYLQNSFFDGYKLPDAFKVQIADKPDAFPVYSNNGDYLFSVLPKGNYLCNTTQLYFPGFMYFLGLLILLFYFRKEFSETNAPTLLKLLVLAAALFIVYWLHLIFQIPAILLHLAFFSPHVFALNNWLPSLGDYFLMILFSVFWLYNFSVDLQIEQLKKQSGLSPKAIAIMLLLFSVLLFLLPNYLIEILVFNSTISFSLNKIIYISAQSVLGIFSIGLLLYAVVVFNIKAIQESCAHFKFSHLLAVFTLIIVLLGGIQYFTAGKIVYKAYLFFWFSSILATFFCRNYLRKSSLTAMIFFVSLASVYSLLTFYHSIAEKERENQKLLAITLVAERDPAAEEFLSKIQQQITNDPAILSLLIQKEDPREYIERAYFNSYFQKYIIEIYVCDKDFNLELQPDNRSVPCFSFMDGIIKDMGVQVSGTNFYFMDNMNGRISYTGRFHYPMLGDSNGVNIYIDLDSDLLFEGIGFPELLIDKSITRSENYRKFNYAKYYGGELTDKFGDYNYNFYVDTYRPSEEEFSHKTFDKYEHLIYHTRENNYVIVSRKIFTLADYLISFPYMFVFYFLVVLVFQFVGNYRAKSRKIVFDLKFKIQAAIISIVFVSLLLVALATIFYNIEEYKMKHQTDLNEKMKSISEEIDMRLEDKDEITPEIEDWLRSELTKLSNIFRTDINIYGIDGDILASSRPEIFQRGLVSSRINAQAYYEIFQNFQFASYFQPEKIGKLSYLSVYKPIINNRGGYLGSINLPYFIKQDNYSQEISTFIVAFINLYVLLFLVSIIIAVFISNQITRPLVVVQENLRKMELGKYNEPIDYDRNDEIGSLVKEYNKKVDELAVSAELLARSERESAWREMAKQIAHEIKNPLTPMKLNIQYLQHTKSKNKEYNAFLERVTSTLIEQIDNLSNIATEFSNFAKMPIAQNQIFVLADQLQKAIDLYETDERANLEFYPGSFQNIRVNADREQLSRAIINLIKNGLQAIPEDRTGTISISLGRRDQMAIVAVSDNGTGIPEELRSKMFSPSFTTKTSGMGLGLSIVKNIVENFAGKIWFEPNKDQGTTFFFEIPIYEEQTGNGER